MQDSEPQETVQSKQEIQELRTSKLSMYIWINDQKQHDVYEGHNCRSIAVHPITTLALKQPQNAIWTQLSITLRYVGYLWADILWEVSKYFSEYCFLSFVKAYPKQIYSSKHSKTRQPHFCKHTEKNNVSKYL